MRYYSTPQVTSNTAVGTAALLNNTEGSFNTTSGRNALFSNTSGSNNTANGYTALQNNTGTNNTAIGFEALEANTTGSYNTANGVSALASNTTGVNNVAIGTFALENNTTGNANIALGNRAGTALTGGSNICIGADVHGAADVDDTTWIGNVYASVATARQVYVDLSGKIGTLSSSRRYKEEIKPMSDASEGLFALRPVTFRYKTQVDATRALSFGLIAEDVAEISPELITRDENGNPQTVRYEAINAMLLNEFLKEHRKNEEQQKQINVLTAQLKNRQRKSKK